MVIPAGTVSVVPADIRTGPVMMYSISPSRVKFSVNTPLRFTVFSEGSGSPPVLLFVVVTLLSLITMSEVSSLSQAMNRLKDDGFTADLQF